jgi:hypothetical protein
MSHLPKLRRNDEFPAPTEPRMLVKFQIEPFHKIRAELPPLFERHHNELGRDKEVVPLDPNWDVMMELGIRGFLRVLTARNASGDLVGYVFNLFGPHMHYRTTFHANVDMYWLDPAYRKGWNGIRMLRTNEAEMKKLGVVRYMIGENLLFDERIRAVFKRLGYVASDTNYRKVL